MNIKIVPKNKCWTFPPPKPNVSNLFDCVDETEGDLTFVKLDKDVDEARLQGVCGSSEDIHDFHRYNPSEFPKGKYLVLRAIDIIEI